MCDLFITMSWLTKEELSQFKSVGENVLISKHAIIYGPENIEIGNNVRIDALCILMAATGYFKIGSFVHLAAHSTFGCAGGIELGDFAQIASHCLLLSASDDFSGRHLIGPTVPEEYRKVYKRRIFVEEGCVIGAGCTILPGTNLCSGAALGAMSMTEKNQLLDHDSIYVGVPAVRKKERHYDFRQMMDQVRKGKF